jgi:hypothetical protein
MGFRHFFATVGLPTLLFVLNSCATGATPPPVRSDIGSCTLALDPAVDDEGAIRAILAAEGTLVVEQEIERLMRLWGEGSRVVNAKHTPNEPGDDQLWLDKDAIRHRYVRTVFPGAPQQASPADLIITLQGDQAIVTATTQIGNEISPAGDRWELTQVGECWVLMSLTYNLEPAAQ